MRQSISGRSLCWARRLVTVALYVFIAFALGLLALRYIVSPQVDRWRAQIAAVVSDSLGVRVELGPLHADWRGWDPGLSAQDLRLRGADGRDLLRLASVRARLDWRALLPGTRAALRLQVRGMDLTVEREPDGRLSLLGLTIDPAAAAAPSLPTWLRWVLEQPLIAFRDVRVRWHDRLLDAPPLVFDDVEAIWTHHILRGATFQAFARAVTAGGTRVQLRARAADIEAVLDGKWSARGVAWLQVSDFQPQRWRPWIPQMPDAWLVGSVQAQAWLQAAPAGPRLTLTGRLRGADWAGPGAANLYLPEVRAWAQGPWARWFASSSSSQAAGGLDFEIRSSGAQLYLPQWFASTLHPGEVAVRGRLLGAGQLQIDQARWRNADVVLDGSGSWRPGGAAGVADFTGGIERADMAAIYRYLPLAVDADAREWLADGLQAGELVHGRWRLQGDLAQFPFGERPLAGDFRVSGDFRAARLDLVPDATRKLSWPLLQIEAGTADLHRMDLKLTASQARMDPETGQSIALSGVQARIPDLEHEATLTVSGHSTAPGDAYMSLIRHSPLAQLLGGIFDEARAGGQWQVPLALTVPLLHSHDTQVQGRVDLHQGSLQFLPQAPVFQDLDGAVHFSEGGVRIPHPLKGRLLGGMLQVHGNLGDAAASGLVFQGRMTAEGIGRYVGLPGMKRVAGNLDYQARLQQRKKAYALTLNSDTAALALDFPAPLAKPAGEKRTLTLQWTDADPRDDVLDVAYGDEVRVVLRHRRGRGAGTYFEQAGVGLGEAAPTAAGLAIGIRYPLVDLDLWNRILDEFSIVRRNKAHAGGQARPLWPDLTQLSVQADQLRLLGTRLDGAVLRAVGSAGEQWSLNLRSRQSTGTLKWQEKDGRVQGHVSGRFARLGLGDDPRDHASLLPQSEEDQGDAFDDDLEIPGIVLEADEFDLYGRKLGALTLEGERDAARHLWQLSRLRIVSGQTTLQGTGTWRLRGPDRGLTLNASVQTGNFGTWLERAGWPDVMVGGSGSLKGQFEWRNLPWSHDKIDLKGELQLALDKGRFPKLGSHTAKLLELLSLQSITRLSKLDRGLSGLLHEGVPFDELRGTASLDRGQAKVQNYKLIGPIGTILLEGSTNIQQETLDMQAVVVPNLDVSGAAIAAGIAINPVVGLGAFITQWLLKTPLAKAMTAHYHITGSWDDPKIDDVPVEASARIGQAPQVR